MTVRAARSSEPVTNVTDDVALVVSVGLCAVGGVAVAATRGWYRAVALWLLINAGFVAALLIGARALFDRPEASEHEASDLDLDPLLVGEIDSLERDFGQRAWLMVRYGLSETEAAFVIERARV